MDRFQTMKAFLRVAETGGFVSAARSLGLAPSVVTKRVAQLEEWLGARLVNRTTRRLSLTDIGASYVEHCARIIAQVEEAELEVRSGHTEPRGNLRLCCPTSFGSTHLAPVLCDMQAIHPELTIELVLIDRPVYPIEEGFDLAVRDKPAPPRGSVREERIAPNRRIVCASPEYIRRRGAPAHPRDLARHDCIHYSFLPTGRRWTFQEDGLEIAVDIVPRFSTNNGRVMRDAAVAGRGIAKLPTFLIHRDLREGLLVPLLSHYPVTMFWITVVYLPAIRLAPKIRLLIDLMTQRFGPEPWDRDLDLADARRSNVE
jgi:DNA-binding transcriptional LysR family regulator